MLQGADHSAPFHLHILGIYHIKIDDDDYREKTQLFVIRNL
jgi:hypothetical protein